MCTTETFGSSLVLRKGQGLIGCESPGALRSEGCLAVPTLSLQESYKRVEERPEMKCRPTFFIIGVRKGGTTDLYVRLTKHPRVVR